MMTTPSPTALAAKSSAKSIIVVEKLTKTFGQQRAVDEVTFDVIEGEIFGFLGPNGAGKSTTINMLTTLIPITSGKAEVCGFDVGRHPNEVRRNVGVVPQDYTADEDMTGYQNILLCADLYGSLGAIRRTTPSNCSRLSSSRTPRTGRSAPTLEGCAGDWSWRAV